MATATRVPHTTTEQTHPVLSIAPVVLSISGRAVPLEVRVSAPKDGDRLPVVILSHGHGPSHHLSSLHGYGPLANYWAAHGFLVVQPTHLDSMTLGLRNATAPEAPLYWRSRATDISGIIDHLDEIGAALSSSGGMADQDRIAVAGHSMGGHTASLLLGARASDPDTGGVIDLADTRVTTGIVLAGVGRGGEALTPAARRDYPVFESTEFAHMTRPVLVVAGDQDASEHLTVAGPAWHTDAYHLAPGPKALVTLTGAGHGLGGISGYDAAETTDESPERVQVVGRLTTAYLRSQLGMDRTAWPAARDDLQHRRDAGRVEWKA